MDLITTYDRIKRLTEIATSHDLVSMGLGLWRKPSQLERHKLHVFAHLSTV
jgi:hypothetical protein